MIFINLIEVFYYVKIIEYFSIFQGYIIRDLRVNNIYTEKTAPKFTSNL